MARHLPIPDMPLRELIRQMFASPEAWGKMVAKKAQRLNLDEWNELEAEWHPWEKGGQDSGVRKQEKAEGEGEKGVQIFSPSSHFNPEQPDSPDWGRKTPNFGTDEERMHYAKEFGPGWPTSHMSCPGDPEAEEYPR